MPLGNKNLFFFEFFFQFIRTDIFYFVFAQHDNFYLITNIWSKAKKIFSINIYLCR